MTSKQLGFKSLLGTALVAGAMGLATQAHAAATILINNLNGPGVGFNDTTAAAPVGGNTGTTLGQQRLIAFTYAANIWGATLTSNVPIVIQAQFSALTCTATSAVLGSAGATFIFNNFPNAAKPNTWYSYALANKIAGADQQPTVPVTAQINANFNVNLGLNANCLPGSPFYLGLDGNHGTGIDFIEVLVHEMGHGVGFQTFTSGSTGAFQSGLPSIWDHYLFGLTAGKLWKDMTAAERVASAISVNGLVWTGAGVTAAVPAVLRQGLAAAVVSGPAAGLAAGTYLVGEASFGKPITGPTVNGELMPVVEQTAAAGVGCEPFNANNTRAVQGRIALIDRGTCGFVVKAKNAQNAGAIGVVIANNAAGAAPSLGGSDATITIPVVSVSQADGNALKEVLKRRSRSGSGVFLAMTTVGTQFSGADPLGRALMYAPATFAGGSSVSHFDTSMFPNQIMEPAINGDLGQSVVPPKDMTFPLLQDIGW